MNVLILAMVGGMNSFAGPIIGSTLMTFVDRPLVAALAQNTLIVYGVAFIVVVLVLPGGLASLTKLVPRLIKRPKARRGLDEQ